MSLKTEINNLLSLVSVKENDGRIVITGIKSSFLMDEMRRVWSSSKLFDFMFITTRLNLIVFDSFFAPDILYVLKVLASNKRARIHHRVINRVIELLYENTWLKNTVTEYPPYLKRENLNLFKWTPLPHQSEFFDIYEKNVPRFKLRGYILGASPGSGKTALSLFLSKLTDCDTFIAVVPKNSVDTVWVDTIKKIYKLPQSYWVTSLNEPIRPGLRHYIFHYERLEEALEFFKKNRFKNPFIVLDESHNLNELKSNRTANFIKLCKLTGSKNILWASGTPVKAIGQEIVPILTTLDDYFTPPVSERFSIIFGKQASRAVDILRNRLGLFTYTVDKKEIVNNDVSYVDVNAVIPNGDEYTLDSIRGKMSAFIQQRLAYYEKNMSQFLDIYHSGIAIYSRTLRSEDDKKELEQYKYNAKQIRDFYDPVTMKQLVIDCNRFEDKKIIPRLSQPLKDQFRKSKSVYKYYILTVQGEALGQVLGRLRAQCHVDMVPHLKLEEYVDTALSKTVIFTSYVEVIQATNEYFTKRKYKPALIYGDTNKDLPSIISNFGSDIDLNPLIATYKSLSTAVPLTMASTAVMLNSPFRNYEYEQAVARLDRLGQNNPVSIYNIFLDTGNTPNISTRSFDIMQWSKQQVEAMLGTKGIDIDIALETMDPRALYKYSIPLNKETTILTSW